MSASLLESKVGVLLNTLIGAILGAEVKSSRPVVAVRISIMSRVLPKLLLEETAVANLPKVFAERACRASALRHQVMLARLHLSLEAIPSNNLMRMRTSNEARIDQRVKSFHCQLRAGEAHHG